MPHGVKEHGADAAIAPTMHNLRQLPLILVLLTCTAACQAAPLGRLFFTQQERAFLDRERQRAGIPTTDAVAPAESIAFNGHITRSSGKSTVWINGKPLHENERSEVSSLRPNERSDVSSLRPNEASQQFQIAEAKRGAGEITIKLPDTRQAYPLKVGQTLTPASGEIREGYQIPPPAPGMATSAEAPIKTATAPADPSNGLSGVLNAMKR